MEKAILLSGTLCTEKMWSHQVESLGDKYDFIIPEITGHDTIKAFVEDLLKDISGEFILVGFSLGGIIALEIMRLAPERVKKLVLIGTNPYPPNEKQFVMWDKFEKMVDDNKFIEITKDHLLPVLIDDSNRTIELENDILEMANMVGSSSYIQQLNMVRTRASQIELLKTISCPTLLIVGEQDVVCPVQLSEFMHENITKSTLQVIGNSGHLISMEQKEEITELFKKWL